MRKILRHRLGKNGDRAIELCLDRDFPAVIRACSSSPSAGPGGHLDHRGHDRGLHRAPPPGLRPFRRGEARRRARRGPLRRLPRLASSSASRCSAVEDDASKAAFIPLIWRLREEGFTLLDSQVYTDHLAGLGAREIPRIEYLSLLADRLSGPADAKRAIGRRFSPTSPIPPSIVASSSRKPDEGMKILFVQLPAPGPERRERPIQHPSRGGLPRRLRGVPRSPVAVRLEHPRPIAPPTSARTARSSRRSRPRAPSSSPSPSMPGTSSAASSWPSAALLAAPRARLVAGGPEVVERDEDLSSRSPFHSLVEGEGEEAFCELLDDLRRGKPLAKRYAASRPARSLQAAQSLPRRRPPLRGRQARPPRDHARLPDALRLLLLRQESSGELRRYPREQAYEVVEAAGKAGVARGLPDGPFLPGERGPLGPPRRPRPRQLRAACPCMPRSASSPSPRRSAAFTRPPASPRPRWDCRASIPRPSRPSSAAGTGRPSSAGAELLDKNRVVVKTGVILGLPFDGYEQVIETFDFLGMHGLGQEAELYPLSLLPGTVGAREGRRLGHVADGRAALLGHFHRLDIAATTWPTRWPPSRTASTSSGPSRPLPISARRSRASAPSSTPAGARAWTGRASTRRGSHLRSRSSPTPTIPRASPASCAPPAT